MYKRNITLFVTGYKYIVQVCTGMFSIFLLATYYSEKRYGAFYRKFLKTVIENSPAVKKKREKLRNYWENCISKIHSMFKPLTVSCIPVIPPLKKPKWMELENP